MGYWPRKILLATDGTEDAPLAALDVSNKSGAELYVVHAWQRETSEAYVLSMPSTSYGWREQRAGRLLDEQVELIEEAGGAVAGSYLAGGEAPEEIAGLVERLDADLLVVGRHEQGPVRRLANRGVSEEISSLVGCPVLVAKGGKGTWPRLASWWARISPKALETWRGWRRASAVCTEFGCFSYTPTRC